MITRGIPKRAALLTGRIRGRVSIIQHQATASTIAKTMFEGLEFGLGLVLLVFPKEMLAESVSNRQFGLEPSRDDAQCQEDVANKTYRR